MRVMLITQLPPPSGGIASWSNSYISYLKSSPVIDLTVLNCALQGRRAVNFNAKRSLVSEMVRAINILKNVRMISLTQKLDVVHLNSTCSPLGIVRDWLCLVLIRDKIPVVLHCHCTIEEQLGSGKFAKYFFKKVANRAHKILVLNQKSKDWLNEQLKLDSEIIPNFIETAKIATIEHNMNNQIKEVVFVGHLLETKGTNEMFAIAKAFPNVHFSFAGSYTDSMKTNMSLGNISLLGDISNEKIIELLDNADLFLFLSYTEGFSISLLEAMARGVPVLASDVGANRDMLESFGGVVVESKSVEKAIQGFEKICAKKLEERHQISVWSLRKVKRCYTIDIIVNKLLAIYKVVIEENNI